MILPSLPFRLAYLAGRAGHRPRPAGVKPVLLVVHTQQGTNNLPAYFSGIGDDSTCWIDLDGNIVFMLAESDTPYTNGDMVEPLDHSNPVVKKLLAAGVTNSNPYSLTVEMAGFPNTPVNAKQWAALVSLMTYWCMKYDIDPATIARHADVGEHKNCPGLAVDRDRLRVEVASTVNALTASTYDPNPDKHAVGPGIVAAVKQHGDILDSDEQYYKADKPDALQHRSFAYAHGQAGNVLYIAYEPAQPGAWDIRRYKEV